MNAHTNAHTIFFIPCAADKGTEVTEAVNLYTSANFAHTLAGAQAEATATEAELGTTTKVMILSALHGALELDAMVAPYNVTFGEAEAIAAHAVAAQLLALDPREVVAMLPGRYARVMAKAVEIANNSGADIDHMNVYEASPGIGYQRGTASALVRNAA